MMGDETMRVHEIATMLGADDRTITLGEPGRVVVFHRRLGIWEVDREMGFTPDQCKSLREMRQMTAELILFLQECRIFVAQSASGALFFELEKARCHVWEITGTTDEFLNYVWEEEEEELAEADKPALESGVPTPVELIPGHFSISIKDIQVKTPEITSKQVLLQFIRQREFASLEIICDHVPPWIELEADQRGFTIEREQLGKNEVRARLIRGQAGGCC
ncbi:conserved hypothetical protein [Methanosphaerula palustris E1-9c]|uniref:Nitrogenase iron-iron accessory protein AnfO n=2 Tax=Methanosphaerula palustris TaxID=475088 RepID=B8GEV9_METPE|nr:conserved hypothetical protein [Methanosphaerula palustris E1-9c]